MATLRDVVVQLREKRDRITAAIAALERINDTGRSGATSTPATRRRHRTLSAEARAKIAAAQRARWAKQKKAKKSAA